MSADLLQLPAILGGRPAFAAPLDSGFHHAPLARVKQIVGDIFAQRYFANNGPLVRRLDAELARHFNSSYAICVVNQWSAWFLLAHAIGLQSGYVMAEDEGSPVMHDAFDAAGARRAQVGTIILVHRFGCLVDTSPAMESANRALVDATRAMALRGAPIVGQAAAAVLSFDRTTVLNGGSGACVLTDDAPLADALRTMRNFSQRESFAPVALRMNAKMSEAQAAMILAGLEALPQVIAANKRRAHAYAARLGLIPGIVVLGIEGSVNWQDIAIRALPESHLTCDEILSALSAEGIPARLEANGTAMLPNGPRMSEQDAERVAEALSRIVGHAGGVRRALRR